MKANPKKHKVGELKTTANEDIISNLPECLLCHVISFLPTKCAVSSCILSKRWKDLWKSTTKLKFSLECEEQTYKFPFFVDQVLRYHSSHITSFSLSQSRSRYLDASIVKSWISAAVNRQVQEINLYLFSGPVLSLPLSLCNSDMLTSLRVCSVGCLELPSKICLSSLKSLHLELVTFPDDLSFNSLFSGLPKIEELKLCYLQSKCPKNGTISLPTLRRLSLNFYGGDDRKTHTLSVNAENLIYLDCSSNLRVDLFLGSMPSLSEGIVRIIHATQWMEKEAYRAVNLLAGFRYAKSLKINRASLWALQGLKSQVNFNFFPTFINLTALKITSRVTSNAASQLIDIFRTAPTLESVVIQEVCGGKWSTKPYPQCIECSLRNCSILCFGGRQADMLFVKFMLKAAKGLERLELCCTQYLCRQEKKLKSVVNELNMLSRASNRCVIHFVTQ